MNKLLKVGTYGVLVAALIGASWLMPSPFATTAEQPNAYTMSRALQDSQAGSILDLDADLNPALNNPDKFSWELLATISGRVENDSNEVFWETWATDGDTFPESPQPSVCTGDDPAAENCPIWPGVEFRAETRNPVTQLEGPAADLPLSRSGEVVYRNAASFNYIVENDLWYLEGLAEKVNTGFEVGFPIGAISVKSHWKQITEEETDRYHWGVDSDGQLWGLTGFHIISNQIPQWVWATFEHVDNPGRCDFIGCHDSYGQIPPDIEPNTTNVYQTYSGDELTSDVINLLEVGNVPPQFTNYRLRGTQVEFTDTTGVPTLLGNSTMEFVFTGSASCIACHAKAAVNDNGQFLSTTEMFPGFQVDTRTNPSFAAPQDLAMQVADQPFATSVFGTPNPLWFKTPNLRSGSLDGSGIASAQQLFMQLDFNWAFFKAKPLAE